MVKGGKCLLIAFFIYYHCLVLKWRYTKKRNVMEELNIGRLSAGYQNYEVIGRRCYSYL